MRGTRLARLRGRQADHGVRSAVQAAVTATHQTRPVVGAHAGQHAAWWHRNFATLTLIADNEFDPVRAEAARADAVTSRRLAEAMAAAHTAQVGEPSPVPPSTSGFDSAATELLDVAAMEDADLEAGL